MIRAIALSTPVSHTRSFRRIIPKPNQAHITHLPSLTPHTTRTTPTYTHHNESTPTKRHTVTCKASRAAKAAAVAAIPHLPAMTWLFTASTIYTLFLTALMVVLPRWKVTRRILSTPFSILPVALTYGVLLLWSWQPDTFSLILPGSWEAGLASGWNPQFFPSLSGIVTLFSRVPTAASLWVHLLAVDLFAARHMYLEGVQYGIPTWHSILLCMTVAPLGLLSHAITKSVRALMNPDA